MSNQFWVYENNPNDKALIHLSTCSHCNDGEGRVGKHKADNGEWFGPFSKAQAMSRARKADRKVKRWCGFCAKKLGIHPENLET